MKHVWKKGRSLLGVLLLVMSFLLVGCSDDLSATFVVTGDETETVQQESEDLQEASEDEAESSDLPEDGEYTSKDEVAAYLNTYYHLPGNFITKKEAKELGWDSKAGNLGEVAPGKSIGGDYFGNYEGLLPEDRDYHECDIDSDGGYRGAKRIVYSDDGLIYYTEDHYETFELLYGEE